MKTIGLYPNVDRDRGLSVTKEVIGLLEKKCSLLVPEAFKEELGSVSRSLTFLSEDRVISRADVLVTLGGDGTILSVAKKAAEADTPIFGINLGHVGFMAAVEKNEISQISRLITGDYGISDRMLLSCFINDKEELRALNEVVIAPEKGFHIVEFSLDTNQRRLCDFRADGVIFHTPTGSTGYSFSAGGAVMEGEFDAIGVKAISSYLLIGAHHMIFSPETVFTASEMRSEGSTVTVCADGREARVLSRKDVVKICRSEKRVRLITLSEKTNHEVFFCKF